MSKPKPKPARPGDKPKSVPRVPPPAYKPGLPSSEYTGFGTPDPVPPAPVKPQSSLDDPRYKSVLPFVRGVCALLPNEVHNSEQQDLLAIAVRMSAFDRDRLLTILERGVA